MTVATLEPTNGIHQESLPQPTITGERATYKANGYLTMHVGMFFGAEEPNLLALPDRLVWQVLVTFLMYDVGPFPVGFLDVDANTGQVVPFTETQIEMILNRTDAFVKLNPSSTTFPY